MTSKEKSPCLINNKKLFNSFTIGQNNIADFLNSIRQNFADLLRQDTRIRLTTRVQPCVFGKLLVYSIAVDVNLRNVFQLLACVELKHSEVVQQP